MVMHVTRQFHSFFLSITKIIFMSCHLDVAFFVANYYMTFFCCVACCTIGYFYCTSTYFSSVATYSSNATCYYNIASCCHATSYVAYCCHVNNLCRVTSCCAYGFAFSAFIFSPTMLRLKSTCTSNMFILITCVHLGFLFLLRTIVVVIIHLFCRHVCSHVCNCLYVL